MNSRAFNLRDQSRFAELSGDRNPMHIDPVLARRLIFGAPVVHGIHLVLWAIDLWLAGRGQAVAIQSIKVSLPKPVRVEDEVHVEVETPAEHRVRLAVINDAATAAKIDISWDRPDAAGVNHFREGHPDEEEPFELDKTAIADGSGSLPLCLDGGSAGRMFPSLIKFAAPDWIATLLATTRVIGMRCPGLHSVYSGLKLVAGSDSAGRDLHYKVKKYDERFGLVYLSVDSPVMTGELEAFVRPEPRIQESYSNLRAFVDEGEFSGQRALVIGGNRGLGEVTAKLLAAGGAQVRVTYSRGAEDARRVVDDIVSGGGSADCVQCDVINPDKRGWEALFATGAPTDVYYYATPSITPGTKGRFSPRLFEKFCGYYVTGFGNLFDELRRAGCRRAFYPSTVYVEDSPAGLGEYAAAKAAGEMLCRTLELENRGLTLYTPRLPRMGTDQTVSLMPADNEDPVPVMLKHLRSFRDRSA